MQPTFRERFCQRHGLPLHDFESRVFSETLYLPARPVVSLLRWIQPDFFSSDLEFIRSVGDIRSRRYFHAEAGEFHTHPSNRGILRRWLRLRVSAERVRRLMEAHWGESESAPAHEGVNSR